MLDNETYVTEVSFYSENNTNYPLSQYELTANILGEGLGTNVKLPKSTNIYVIAKLSNGDQIYHWLQWLILMAKFSLVYKYLYRFIKEALHCLVP